jgi:hypothetical protein
LARSTLRQNFWKYAMPEPRESKIATAKTALPRGTENGGQFMISRATAMTSAVMVALPKSLAWITTFWDAAIPRSPVMARSRPTISTTIQAGTRPTCTKEIRLAEIRSLSATGSRSFPRVVTWRMLRAMRPSSQSVRTAARNTTAAVRLYGRGTTIRNTTRTGTRKIRTRLSAFGRFTRPSPWPQCLIS